MTRIEAMNDVGQQADGQDLVADVHDLPRDGRAHDRRPRRPQARARVRHRVDGRPQARRVRAHAHATAATPAPAKADEPRRRRQGRRPTRRRRAGRRGRGRAEAADAGAVAQGRGDRGEAAAEEKAEARAAVAPKASDEAAEPKAEAAERRGAGAARRRPKSRGAGGEAEDEADAEAEPTPRRRRPTPAPRRDGRSATPNGRRRPLVRAQARYVRTSARKARLVCDHIRGKSVEEARAILAFTPRAVARDWSKLLESAVANAEHNHELVGDELRITDASTPTRARRSSASARARWAARRASASAPATSRSRSRRRSKDVAMGQKVHPEALRVGYIHDWKSNWFNERHFADYLDEDVADPRAHHRQARARRPVRHHDPQGRQRGRGQHPHGPARAS